MEKIQFVLNSKMTFEVDGSLVKDSTTFKEAMDNGCVKVVDFDVDLIKENGEKCYDSAILDPIKDAIIYGLLERA